MKIEHIRKTKDFREVFKDGKKLKGKVFSLHVLNEAGSNAVFTGVVAAKKFAPRAVKRNYIRRLVYTAFREHAASFRRGTRIIARLSHSVEGIKKRPLSKAIGKDIERLLEQAGII